MATIVTRAGKGSPLTNTELDSNFSNLNTDKLELSGGSLTGNLNLGDNVKAQFGSPSNDLQIYHDGSNSYISDVGTGALFLKTNYLAIAGANGNQLINAEQGGAIELYHANAKKLETTSTGIDVTGSVVADGLVSAGTAFINLTSRPTGVPATAGALWSAQTETGNYGILTKASSTDSFTYIGNTGSSATLGTSYGSTGSYLPLDLQTSDTKRLRIANNGDISFYNSAGTSQNLFWDSSTSRLGVGTTLPLSALNVKGTQGQWRVDPDSVSNHVEILSTNTANTGFLNLRLRANDFIVQTGGSDRLTINSSGNASFSGAVTANQFKLSSTNFIDSPTTSIIRYSVGSGDHVFFSGSTSNSELLRINGGNGNVNIPNGGLMVGSTTAPEGQLTLQNDDASLRIRSNTTTTKGLTLRYNHAGNFGQLLVDHQGNNQLDMKYHALSHTFGRSDSQPFMTINSSGVVNIPNGGLAIAKTSAPDALLDIDAGTVSSAPSARFRRNHGAQSFQHLSGLSFYWNTSNGLQDNTIVYGADANSSLKFTHATGSAFHDRLTIASSGNVEVKGGQELRVYRGDNATYGSMKYLTGSGGLQFNDQNNDGISFVRAGSTESMRIDSSGNLLVGKTSSSGGTEGIELTHNHIIVGTRNGDTCQYLNRLTSAGKIIEYQLDGTTRGALSLISNDLCIHSTTSSHSGLRFANGAIHPTDHTGAQSDSAQIDLGGNSYRFNDLYLQGGVKIGGNGAANTLDDYEEGTWTPTLVFSSGSVAYGNQLGTYTKVGRQVTVQMSFGLSAVSSPSGAITISGLPFTNSNGEGFVTSVNFGLIRNLSTAFNTVRGFLNTNSTIITLTTNATNSDAQYLNANTFTHNTLIYATLTYFAS